MVSAAAAYFYGHILICRHQLINKSNSFIIDRSRGTDRIYHPLFYSKRSREPSTNYLKMDISYIINELGEERENYFNAVSPPIMQTSNFALKTVKEFREALADQYYFDLYSRGN